MGGIILDMMETKGIQGQVTREWFDAFNESFGIAPEKISSRQLAEDIERKMSEEFPQKLKRIKGLFARYRKSKSKFLVSQEDVEEVIRCCLWVLDVIYEIRFCASYSIKMRHLSKEDSPVKLMNKSGAETDGKTRKKRPGKHKNEGTIYISYNEPYISVVTAFLIKCFEKEIEELRDSKNSEVLEDSRNPGKQDNMDEMGMEKKQSEEQEEIKQHIVVWLVANCLYIMGELAYAEQYVAFCQKNGENEGFIKTCKLLGTPWVVNIKLPTADDAAREECEDLEHLPLLRQILKIV